MGMKITSGLLISINGTIWLPRQMSEFLGIPISLSKLLSWAGGSFRTRVVIQEKHKGLVDDFMIVI